MSDDEKTSTIKDAEWRGAIEARVRSCETRLDETRNNIRALYSRGDESGRESARLCARLDAIEGDIRAMESTVSELRGITTELVGEIKKVVVMGTFAMAVVSGAIALVVNLASK